MPYLNDLPFEIIIDICSHIDVYTLHALSRSCRGLSVVKFHPSLWRQIDFMDLDEQITVERAFLNNQPLPEKIKRIDDNFVKRLINMLIDYKLNEAVTVINLDFTSVKCTSVWDSINGFPNLVEISLRGCSNLSLKDLGVGLTWFEPLTPSIKLQKLNVLWCKDMDTRLPAMQKLNTSGIQHFKEEYTKLFYNLKKLPISSGKPLQLDITSKLIS
nr:15148_t:CDS:2 [Entrophospora candida]CAG8439526.1 9662_t:CDS:2 [Entrophospora candida]